MPNEFLVLFAAAVFGLTVIPLAVAAFFRVEPDTTAVVQRLGKFQRVAEPGWHVLLPFAEMVVGRVDMRVQQINVVIWARTEDDAAVCMVMAVQYCVLPEKVHEAFCTPVTVARGRIKAYVVNVVRARVPKRRRGDLLGETEAITAAIECGLSQFLNEIGYGVIQVLVTDIDSAPQADQAVKGNVGDS